MTYVPVYCDTCAHASLAVTGDVEERLQCTFCEAQGRVIPGPMYGDGDWLAFAEIDAAVFEASLDGVQAMALFEELQALLDREEAPLAIVQAMIGRLPTLVRARPALVDQLPRGVRMLKTLLLARARDLPLRSGAHNAPVIGVADPRRRSNGSDG